MGGLCEMEDFFNLSCEQQKHVKFLDLVASYTQEVDLLAEFKLDFPAEETGLSSCSCMLNGRVTQVL
ncbi:hypothetical protein L1987_61410 [Smallanthus sonchifolius]|uniref:Uncharacterized protein n=1 Tax=Smallanthus sonchifolius TaxID=185202 RepID=A0ACB9C7I9_9ASTR|nr:hypothetical protein L1987_61410 [Smallanthus sonchifolius]